jgi:hypothetical protein
MSKFPNLTVLLISDQAAALWPDELRGRGFEVHAEKVDGLVSGHIDRTDARVYVSEQLGPNPGYSNSRIAGRRLLMVYTAKRADVHAAEQDLALLGQVVSVLEANGATRLGRDHD